MKECDKQTIDNINSARARTIADSRTEKEPGTIKSIGTNQSALGWNSVNKIKPTEFNDLFILLNDEQPKKRVNITLEMSLLKIYTKMRSEFLCNHMYYNFIKDVYSM